MPGTFTDTTKVLEFSAAEISKIIGIRHNLLKQWLFRGYIEPSGQKAEGPGTRHLFGWRDAYRLGLFRSLTSAGLTREESAKCIKLIPDADIALVECGTAKTSRYLIVTEPKSAGPPTLLITDKPKSVRALIGSGEYVLIFNLETIFAKVHEGVDALFQAEPDRRNPLIAEAMRRARAAHKK